MSNTPGPNTNTQPYYRSGINGGDHQTNDCATLPPKNLKHNLRVDHPGEKCDVLQRLTSHKNGRTRLQLGHVARGTCSSVGDLYHCSEQAITPPELLPGTANTRLYHRLPPDNPSKIRISERSTEKSTRPYSRWRHAERCETVPRPNGRSDGVA